MKFVAELSGLLGAISRCRGAVERRNTIPILSNVKLEVMSGAVKCTATDLDMEITTSAAAAIDVPGSITVPAFMLHDMLKKLPPGAQVSIEADATGAVLKAGKSRYKLSCLPVEDFPQFSGVGERGISFEVPAADLRRLIDKSRIAMSTEETRFYLNGIYLHAADGALRAVATDGHKLVRCDVDLPDGAKDMPGVIVPRKVVGELAKLIGETSSPVSVAVSDTKISFSVDGFELCAKLIDGTFPDYQRVIPPSNDNVVSVSKDEFVTAIDRVKVVLSDRTAAVRVDISGDAIGLSCRNSDGFEANESVDQLNNASRPLLIGFNGEYLKSILDKVGGEAVSMAFSDAGAPALISDSEDKRTLYVVMPMRV